MNDQIIEVYLDDIIPNRFQPRERFNEESINSLANSIKKYGLIEPMVLRKIGDKFEIIAGERRYKASTIAGLEKVPAIIKDLNDSDSAEVALIENIQREDLTVIEKARSYDKLLKMSGETQEELAKKLGVSQPSLSNTMRLLGLDEEVQQALLERRISERHARSLLQIKDNEMQKEILEKIINERMTVRSLDMYIDEMNSNAGGEQTTPQTIVPSPVQEVTVENPEVNTIPVMQPMESLGETLSEAPKPIEVSEVVTPTISQVSDFETAEGNIGEKPEKPNFDMLLKPVEVPEIKDVDLDSETANMEMAPESEPITITSEPINEPEIKEMPIEETTQDTSNSGSSKILTAINTVRQSISTIEKYGFKVDSDEMDLGNEYQFIVTISKE